MSDEYYLEEQRSEVEILQSIYPSEFTELAESPYKFSIEIALDDDELPASTVLLTVEYTATYPDELPVFDLALPDADADADSEDGNVPEPEAELDDDDLEEFKEKTRVIGEESLGMAMVFNMAMHVKELMAERLTEKLAEIKRREDERIQKEVEADQAKFIGTQVTRASFLEWKEKFDMERAETKKAALAAAESRGMARRTADSKKQSDMMLTGRQLFEQDRSLAQSDSKFISEGDVAVDSSLFENEDLSEDDDSDDE
ncbi:rwd domain-containing protein [Linderina pennispora]|nr:rwd domain-containing protein [Linderina pennispora]